MRSESIRHEFRALATQAISGMVSITSEAPAIWETIMWKREETSAATGSHQSPPPSAPIARDAADKLVMNLGKTVMIKGELSGSEDLTLYGRMEGSVKLPEYTLTIGPDADIRAEISAKTVVIMGGVTGNVIAGEKVEIRSSGSVTGDVASPRFAIQDGGCMRGKVATSKGDLKQNRT
jgi:cytoskeletal protein CcmA (bactofilin family)